MSELACLHCEHGPHRNKACVVCGCETWVRADVAGAGAAVLATQMLARSIPAMQQCLVDILDLLCVMNPEAVEKLSVERKKMQEEFDAAQKDNEAKSTPAATGDSDAIGAGSGAEPGDIPAVGPPDPFFRT